MIIIDYAHGSSRPKRFVSEAHSIIIGRASPEQPVDLDLSPDTSVSRRHASVTYENGTYWIKDLNSKAGTRINEQRIEVKTRLGPGDKVRIGLTLLEILIPEDGILTNSISAAMPASELIMTQKIESGSLDAARHRLLALYELGIAIGATNAVEPLLHNVVEHLCRVIIDAQRAVILLAEEAQLLPKAFIPETSRPPLSLNLARLAIDNREALTWRFGMPGKAGELYDSVVRHGTQAAMYAPLIWKDEVLGVIFVDNIQDKDAFNEDDLRLLMAMANQIAMFIKNYRLQQELLHQEVIRSNLLRQFSPQIAERIEELVNKRDVLRLGGERAEPVTILTSDVRGFTALTAHMEPSDIVQMLNELFSVCIPIIFKYNGTVDKYVGDAILAVFGSPEPDEQQWQKAVHAAIEMQAAIAALGQARARQGLTVCQVGIGIHTGVVLHGFIGSEERMEYTVIGEAVNRASRYCDGAAPGEIVISEAVYQQIVSQVVTEPKLIRTKHPETEADLEAYVVKAWREPSEAGEPLV
jgi:adenylate cyclase